MELFWYDLSTGNIRNNWQQAVESLENIYSYTMDTHHKYCSDVVFKDVHQIVVLKTLFWVGLISCASHPTPPLQIPNCHFRPSNGGLSSWAWYQIDIKLLDREKECVCVCVCVCVCARARVSNQCSVAASPAKLLQLRCCYYLASEKCCCS